MEVKMYNPDGTVSFERIDNMRDSFEDAFAKKCLGAAMKDIIIKSIPNRVDNESILNDDGIKSILTNAIAEIANTAYTEKELNGRANYINSIIDTVKEYASMEADYRMEVAAANYEANKNKVEASSEIRDLFSLENLDFSNNELKNRYIDEMELKHGQEGEDIVVEIGKEVGKAIADAETKNIVINQTTKAINDQKKELEEELEVNEEEPEDGEDNSDSGESENSENLDGSETDFDNDSEDPNEDETSEESFDYGTEGILISQKDRAATIELLDREKEKIMTYILENYDRLEESLKDMSGSKFDKDVDWQKNNIKVKLTKTEFEKMFRRKFEITLDSLRGKKGNFITGNSKAKFDIDIAEVKGIENWKLWTLAIAGVLFFWLGTLICVCILCNDEDEKNIQEVKRRVKNELDYSFTKCVVKKHVNRKAHPHTFDATICLRIEFNLARINRKGIEDYITIPSVKKNFFTGTEEVDTIIETLKENIDNKIEDGELSIGYNDSEDHYQEPDLDKPSQVSDYSNSDNEKETDQADENGVGEPEITEANVSDDLSAQATSVHEHVLENMSSEDYKEYTGYIFSNENISKTLVPLSPLRFDSLPDYSAESLAAIYLRGSEGLSSLRNVIEARFEGLSEIVSRESDEELTKKLETYKERSIEAFNDAEMIRDSLNSVGLDTFGIEDVNDKLSLNIGSKVYKYANNKLKIKNIVPKEHWKSVEDGIDSVFDMILVKDALRNAHKNKDSETMISLKNDLMSRESLYYENLATIEGDEDKKNAIANLIKIDEVNLDKSFIQVDKFTESLKIALDTTKVKTTKPDVSDEKINNDIYNRAKNRIEFITNKEVTPEQSEIINAMIEGRDISDYAPTPFEKFVLTIGEDKVKENKDYELSGESAGYIQDEACLRTVLWSFVNKTKPFSDKSIEEFNQYLFGELK